MMLGRENGMKKHSYEVDNFEYNGFCGKILKGIAPYEVIFKKWTSDPGVGVFECSDNEERLIPTFAIRKFDMNSLPEQSMNSKVYFGLPSHS